VQTPALQVPGPANERYVPASAQWLAGGDVQETPAHGSPLHAVPEHPDAQYCLWLPYEHTPAAQVPGRSKTVRLLASKQYEAGSVLQATPAHGSPLQASFAHPKAQYSRCGTYTQAPALQVRGRS
jgi:hypothetical protein